MTIRTKDYRSAATPRGARTYRFVISTGDIDRMNDTLNPAGWDLTEYKRNPVVLFAHDMTQPPIARCPYIAVEGNRLVADAEFPPDGIYPLADTIRGLVDGGYLLTTSVGFKPITAVYNGTRKGTDYETQSLLEWSVVSVPANTAAVLVGARSADLQLVHKWLAGGHVTPSPIRPPDLRVDDRPLLKGEFRIPLMAEGGVTSLAPQWNGVRHYLIPQLRRPADDDVYEIVDDADGDDDIEITGIETRAALQAEIRTAAADYFARLRAHLTGGR